ARALGLRSRPERTEGAAVVGGLHLEAARPEARRPVDDEAPELVVLAEVEREPLRRPGRAAPRGRGRGVERVLGRGIREAARRGQARWRAQRAVLEAEVFDRDRAAAAGGRGDRELDRAELAHRAAAGGPPGEGDLDAADAQLQPLARDREGVAVP